MRIKDPVTGIYEEKYQIKSNLNYSLDIFDEKDLDLETIVKKLTAFSDKELKGSELAKALKNSIRGRGYVLTRYNPDTPICIKVQSISSWGYPLKIIGYVHETK